jgi:hypothetical protein
VPQPTMDSNKGINNLTFGKNVEKKIRKHIDQVRKRHGTQKEIIPSPSDGGIEVVQQIIRNRVSQGGGYSGIYAGESTLFFPDGNVVYVIRENGEFWTILKNIKNE